ncbi:S-adenosyl-L-methionine-dependent methyltransferase [Fimicolochytrium jonesii]|uniref:S-adenosyl-L-methionine-dependent methyltransferase n=1 Tax=Fimicolochytrium jonesii TaxID=1396493 RepID=UPI0022FE3709|nr:S-adenosyl-L-methionine-dependent methyltransferase [Fimicolochytrium jonesii]KAI8820868.1 S-adenosyl-L-methionine-dependent methyltransferase [Fimicolochytrium jonesii]
MAPIRQTQPRRHPAGRPERKPYKARLIEEVALKLIHMAGCHPEKRFCFVLNWWCDKPIVRKKLERLNCPTPLLFVISQREVIHRLAKERLGDKYREIRFFSDHYWNIDKPHAKLRFADIFSAAMRKEKEPLEIKHVVLDPTVAWVFNAYDKLGGLDWEELASPDRRLLKIPTRQPLSFPSRRLRGAYWRQGELETVGGVDYFTKILVEHHHRKEPYERGDHVVLCHPQRGLEYGVIDKFFEGAPGRPCVVLNRFIPFGETSIGKTLFAGPAHNEDDDSDDPVRQRFDYIDEDACKKTFSDHRWYFATDKFDGYPDGELIPIDTIIKKAWVHRLPERCPDDYDQIWVRHRYIEDEHAYVNYHHKEKEVFRRELPELPATMIIHDGDERPTLMHVTEIEGHTVHGYKFSPLRDHLRRRPRRKFKCKCHGKEDLKPSDVFENEWVLEPAPYSATVDDPYDLRTVVMQYNDSEDGVPAHLKEYKNGAHPRYVHFFRFYLTSQGGLAHVHPDDDIARKYPQFEQQYPIARTDEDMCELWAGAGVAGCGFESAGFTKKWVVENDPYALKANVANSKLPGGVEVLHARDSTTEEKPYGGCDFSEVLRDIHLKKIRLPSQIGVATTTFPCTHNSNLNRNPDCEKSEFDRTSLMQDISLKILEAFPAHYGMLENVPELEHKQPRTFAAYQAFLLLSKYQVRKFKCNSAAFGVPQDRNRLFLVYAPSCCTLPAAPIPTHQYKNATSALFAAPAPKDALANIADNEFEDPSVAMTPLSEKVKRWIPLLKHGESFYDLQRAGLIPANEYFDPCKRPRWAEAGQTFGTITCDIRKGDAHPLFNRKLNLLEKMLLQGLPLNWILFGTAAEQARQIGNGVVVALTFAIAMEMRKAMSLDERRRRAVVRGERIKAM